MDTQLRALLVEPHHGRHEREFDTEGDIHADPSQSYSLLRRRQRNLIRLVCREAYLNHPSDHEAAKDEACREVESIFITILLGVAIKLVVDLIAYWIENGIFDLPAVYQRGEPGFDE